MALIDAAKAWIATAWREAGSSFNANDLPVLQFLPFDVDDMGTPFRSKPLSSWRLLNGELVPDAEAKLQRVPYIAFSLDEASSEMAIQVQWAPRCGYGYAIRFGPAGDVLEQKMRWVS